MNKYKFENYGINEIIERKNIYSFLNISAYDEILILVEWTVIKKYILVTHYHCN